MSVLMPGARRRAASGPRIYIGTSVGAINAAYLASSLHLPAAGGGRGRHRALARGQQGPGRAADPAPAGAAHGRSLRGRDPLAAGRAAPEPARPDAARAATFAAGSTGTTSTRTSTTGRVEALAAVATGGAHRPHGRVRRGPRRARHATARTRSTTCARRLDDQHVRASAAIPILFPPVRVEQPREARGWYFDGGTRLNTPIKPALDLGAEKLIVVATDSVAEPSKRPGRHESEPPDFGDGALHVLQGMLVDPVVEDMRILGNINMFFAEQNGRRRGTRGGRQGRRLGDGAEAARTATARRAASRRTAACPTSSSRPRRRGAIGRLASRGLPRPLRRHQGASLARLPAAQPAARRREPDARRAAQLPLLRPGVHRGADPDGPARRPPLAALGPGPQRPWQIQPLDAFMQPSGNRVSA